MRSRKRELKVVSKLWRSNNCEQWLVALPLRESRSNLVHCIVICARCAIVCEADGLMRASRRSALLRNI